MGRSYGKIKISIWSNDEFRALPRTAQHLYFVLISHPLMGYAGVVDWRPGKIAAICGGTAAEITADAAELGSTGFVVIDEAAEEILVRSFIRSEALMRDAKLSVSVAKAYGVIASSHLRKTVVHELQRIHLEESSLNAWKHDLIAPILLQNSIDPAVYRATAGLVGEAATSNLSTDVLSDVSTNVWGQTLDQRFERRFDRPYNSNTNINMQHQHQRGPDVFDADRHVGHDGRLDAIERCSLLGQ